MGKLNSSRNPSAPKKAVKAKKKVAKKSTKK